MPATGFRAGLNVTECHTIPGLTSWPFAFWERSTDALPGLSPWLVQKIRFEIPLFSCVEFSAAW
jgi:hypothetical protein